MKTPETTEPSLAQIEAEVMSEGREWTRKRMAARLQQLADTHGEVAPQSQKQMTHRHAQGFHLDTGAGRVEVQAWHGQVPSDGHWGSPLRERWQLAAYPQLSPGWQQQVPARCTRVTMLVVRLPDS